MKYDEEIETLKKSFEVQIAQVSQEQVASDYVSSLLMQSMSISMTRSREALADLSKSNKTRSQDADGLYMQLLEAQTLLKQKDAILDKTEQEFNRIKDTEEDYRDKIDLLQNELSDLRKAG